MLFFRIIRPWLMNWMFHPLLNHYGRMQKEALKIAQGFSKKVKLVIFLNNLHINDEQIVFGIPDHKRTSRVSQKSKLQNFGCFS